MAEVMLRHHLRGVSGIDVASAGFLEGGVACPPHVVEVMREVGIDISAHRSRRIHAGLVDQSDLIVAMSRQHAIDLAVGFPQAWSRCFTVSELEERAAAAGGPKNEDFGGWVARLSGDRVRSDLLRLPVAADVMDPIGKPLKQFRQVRDRLWEFAGRLAPMLTSSQRL